MPFQLHLNLPLPPKLRESSHRARRYFDRSQYNLMHTVAHRLAAVSLAPASLPKTDAPAKDEQVVTPWDVQGSVSADGKQMAIDYDKLIEKFGTRPIDVEILARFEKLTGVKPHPFLRRGLFFSHR